MDDFEKHKAKLMKKASFRKVHKESEHEYQLERARIKARIQKADKKKSRGG